jgi:DNA-binding transcriptional ArsR family regulator
VTSLLPPGRLSPSTEIVAYVDGGARGNPGPAGFGVRIERPDGALVEALPIGQPAVSKHLRVLREAGLVRVRGDGRRRLYRVDPAPLRELDAWLAPYRQLWAQRLDALDTEIARGRRALAEEDGR